MLDSIKFGDNDSPQLISTKQMLSDWWQLYLLLFLVSFFVALVIGVTVGSQRIAVETDRLNNEKRELDQVGQLVTQLIFTYDFNSAESIGKALLARPDVAYAKVVDNSSFVVFSGENPDYSGGETKVVDFPLVVHELGKPPFTTGVMTIGLAHQPIGAIYWNAVLVAVMSFFGVVSISFLMGYFYIRRFVIAPLDELSKAIDATVKSGDPVMTNLNDGAYIGRFATQFNLMQKKLVGVHEGLATQMNITNQQASVLENVLTSVGQHVRVYHHLGGYTDYNFDLSAEPLLSLFPSQGIRIAEQLVCLLNDHKIGRVEICDTKTSSTQSVLYEVEITEVEGRLFHVTAVELSSDDMALIVKDITSAREFEMSLVSAQKMETVGMLTSGIAHDFNNILSIVMGGLQLIESSPSDTSVVIKHADVALNAAKRGRSIITSLLAFSRKSLQAPIQTSIVEALQAVVTIAKDTVGSNIQLDTRFDCDTYVLVDLALLETALLNLVVNARDAMPRGGKIELSVKPASLSELIESELDTSVDYSVISVQDEGVGIDEKDLDKVLNAFFTTKKAGEGTGLGLAMVQRFVDESNGAMLFSNNSNKGATFSIILPNLKSEDVYIADSTEWKLRRKTYTEAANGLVLLVDDESHLLNLLAIALRQNGVLVEAVESVSQASNYLEESDNLMPALIVTDLNLSDGSGVELLEHPVVNAADIPVILMSGNMDHGYHGEVNIDAFTEVLYKPCDLGEFVEVVQRNLSVSEQRLKPCH